jgi:hypothetical protein
MPSLEDVAKEVKAAAEIINTVSGLLEDAARSAIIEINNATSRTLRRIPWSVGDGHRHGAFQAGALPKDKIDPYKSDVFGSRSSAGAIAVGTEGNVWYDLDDEGTKLHVRWNVPFAGGNESGSHVEGPHADWYTVRYLISGGNKKVQARYVIGENAAIALDDPHHYVSDWRTCGRCKAIFFALDQGVCPEHSEPAEGEFTVPGVQVAPGFVLGPHEAAGDTFKLLHGVLGPNREPGWRRCQNCKELFYNGWDSKGVCPAHPDFQSGPIGHVADADSPDFHLAFDVPPRPWQQNDWRFCTKCFGLFFLPHNADGDCPGGGIHHAHPFNYMLDHFG